MNKDLEILREAEEMPELRALISKFEEGKNIFLNGQAGTGKTYLLNKFLRWLEVKEKDVQLAGSTGVAAINIGGTTLHRMFGIGLSSNVEEFKENLKKEVWLRNSHKKRMMDLMDTNMIIIDEVSMVSAELLELMDFTLRMASGFDEPFGGIQIMFTGDFYQLPPVSGGYAFESPVWKDLEFSLITLTKIKRQDNPEFMEILGKIRKGEVDQQVLDFVNSKATDEVPDDSATKLYARNKSVDAENHNMIKSLDGKSKVYNGELDGELQTAERIHKTINSPRNLELKIGAKVMSMVNDTELEYVNGSVGKVIKMSNVGVTVEFEVGDRYVNCLVEPFTWTSKDGKGNILASYTQIPLRPAYAITIHKSQGMTIDGELYIDCSGIRSEGQFYVALSRIKNPDKLKLVNFEPSIIKASNKAKLYFD